MFRIEFLSQVQYKIDTLKSTSLESFVCDDAASFIIPQLLLELMNKFLLKA